MSDFTIFQDIGARIIVPFTSLNGAIGTLVPLMISILISGLTINIMWHGYEVIRGKGGANHMLDILAMSVRVGLVISLGLSLYTLNVVGFINEFISYFGGLFASSGADLGSGSGSPTMLKTLDSSCGQALDSFKEIWDIANGTNGHTPTHISMGIWTGDFDMTGVIMIFQGLVMLFAFGIYACLAAFETLYINIALLIFFAIGPLFIASYAFKSTEQWFNSWLSGVMKYAMTAIIIGMVLGLANSIFDNYTASITNDLSVLDLLGLGISTLCACALLIVLIKKIPELAGNIVGGLGVSTGAASVGAVKDSIKSLMAKSTPSPKQPSPNAPNPNNPSKSTNYAMAGISKGIGAMMEGAGKGIGGVAQGVGAAASGIGKGIGNLAQGAKNQGAGSITGSNMRPVGRSMQSMMNAS
jgi:type IV secretion system protein VirB6